MFDQLLAEIESDQNISDIVMSSGSFLAVRKNGQIIITSKSIDQSTIDAILQEIEKQSWSVLTGNKEVDCTYQSTWWYRYRINSFLKQWARALAIRKISNRSFELDELMITPLATTIKQKILSAPWWLFLVTWVAWSGKSTTLTACLNFINEHLPKHIITIEDPIEFVYQSKKSIFSQRQVEHDTIDFTSGLKSLLRQNPDIVLVGEIRDRESAEAVLTIAETWHLILSTLHTKSAINTVSRFISLFPVAQQDSVRDRFADVFLWSLAQQLIPLPANIHHKEYTSKIAWNAFGRIGLYELLLNTTAVSNSIRKGDFKQIPSCIQTWRGDGMITMEEYYGLLTN